MIPTVIVVGGSDSSGGAGLSRDIATLAELGCEARPVLTAVTAQTSAAVAAIELVSPQFVARQLSSALETGPVGAVKIGMLGNGAIVAAIAKALSERLTVPVIIDPVIASSSGRNLLTADGMEALKRMLLPLCHIVTPNLPEASMLTGMREAGSHSDLADQANVLRRYGAKFVLIKGGHGEGEEATDWLFGEHAPRGFCSPRLAVEKRGTGCSLATAIAAHLAAGHSIDMACSLAKEHVNRRLRGPGMEPLSGERRASPRPWAV